MNEFEILMVETVKDTVCWDVTAQLLEIYQQF
jgi:hypothetical protein